MTASAAQHRQLDLFGARRMTKRPLDQTKLAQIAAGIFRASRPVAGTLGARFFEMRGLAVPGPDVARYHPSLKCGDARSAGLIFLLRDVRTREPCGVMRLYLDEHAWVTGMRPLGRVVGATLNRYPRPP